MDAYFEIAQELFFKGLGRLGGHELAHLVEGLAHLRQLGLGRRTDEATNERHGELHRPQHQPDQDQDDYTTPEHILSVTETHQRGDIQRYSTTDST